MKGEVAYLDPEQSVACRLFGCNEPYVQVILLNDVPGFNQAVLKLGLCPRHTRMLALQEIAIGGKAALPPTT